MLRSKIPVRAPSKLPVVSDSKNEKRHTIAQQKDQLVRKRQTTEIKQSYQISKDRKGNSNPLLGNEQNKNFQHKLTQEKIKQESQPCFRDRSKNILKKNEKGGAKEIPQHVLKELNGNKKPVKSDEKGQQPKMVKEKNSVPSLKIRSKKPTNPTNIQQTHQSSVLNVRSQKKVECPKIADNHPSQPDIEFVPDENCRNRILSGRELSPGILRLPPRTQSLINRKFSIHKPMTVPVDPYKTMLKAMENIDSARRLSVKKYDFQVSPFSERFSLSRKTPVNAFDSAMKRMTELKLKEKPKSARKVTFKLPDSDLKPTASATKRNLQLQRESKHESCQLRLTDISDNSDLSSQHSTLELDVNITSYAKIPSNGSQLPVSDNEKTPTITSFQDIITRIRQQNNAVDLPNIRKVNEMPSSILRRNNIIATDCDEKRGSLFCCRDLDSNFRSRELRRSTSASELSRCPQTVLLDASSKFSSKIDTERSNKIENSSSLHPSLNIKILRTSISSPEIREMFPYNEMPSSILRRNNIIAATDCNEKRGSLFCCRDLDSNFISRKLRRSTSASELSRCSPSTSAQTVLLDASSKFSSKIDTERSNKVENSSSLHPSLNIKMLRTSISSPEIREMFPYDEMPSSILRRNNIIAATDCDEKRGSLFCCRDLDSNFISRKLRRSTSASELSRCPPSTSAQTVLLDASSKFSSKIDTERSNKVENSSSLHPSLNIKMLRTSISSPEIREMFPYIAAEGRLENCISGFSSKVCSVNKLGLFSQKQNPLLYSQNKDFRIRPHNVLANSVRAAELRGSLYLPTNKNVIQSNNSQATSKLCTPCPVSFYPKSRVADSSSPEFLCTRTSNIISHAPIKTPLVMRNLAERDQFDDDLSPVRKKLDFKTVQKEAEDSKVISRAYLQTQQIILDSLADQECCIILSHAVFPYICIRDLPNPIAEALGYSDEMDFLQKPSTMFNSTQSGEKERLLKDKYDYFPSDYSKINSGIPANRSLEKLHLEAIRRKI